MCTMYTYICKQDKSSAKQSPPTLYIIVGCMMSTDRYIPVRITALNVKNITGRRWPLHCGIKSRQVSLQILLYRGGGQEEFKLKAVDSKR